MPKYLTARPPLDATEERHVRKLTHSVHAPADWIFHAKMVASSWDGLRTRQIAEALGCHPQTVRERLQAFNERGFKGLGMKPGGGRKSRLTEHERSTILYLIHFPHRANPPMNPLASCTSMIPKARSNGRSMPSRPWPAKRGSRWPAVKSGASSAKKVRWRHTRLWASSKDPDFVPKGQRSSASTPLHPKEPPSSVSTNSVP